MSQPHKSPQTPTTTREQPLLATRAAVVPASLDSEKRTVEVTWSTGADVVRRDYWTGDHYIERLSMDPAHIRLDRLRNGAPVLDTHSSYGISSVIGVVESADVANSEGVAKLRFSDREDVAPVWGDVAGGILRSISVGYIVHEWRVTKASESSLEVRTAIDWEPYELSLVPIPADAGAQVRSYESEEVSHARAPGSERSSNMSAETLGQTPDLAPETAERSNPKPEPSAADLVAAERKRVSAIAQLCRQHGIDAERQAGWIDGGTSLDAVRTAILDGLAERSAATQVRSVSLGDGRREQSMVRDMTATLLARAGHKVEGDGHRRFGDGNLLRLAEDVLSSGGVNVRTLSRSQIATRAIATSDFASIVNAAGEKIVRAAYQAAPLSHRTAFRRTTSSDFKAKNVVAVAAGAPLAKLEEGGQIAQRSPVASNAQYKLDTFAGIVSLTRQMIVNDDFGLFERTATQRGRAAAETERKVVWDLIASNPGSFFSGANTTSAAAGATVDVDELAAAREALRTAKAPDGTAIGATLKFIVCGPSTETKWEQLLSPLFVPASAANAVPAGLRNVTLLVEPAITDDGWFGFADFGQIDTVEYAYLAGSEGVQLEQRLGFDTDGIELRALLDFGAGLIDPAGCYRMAQS